MKFCPECGKRLDVGGFCSACNLQYGAGQGQGSRRQRAEFQIFKDFEFETLSDGTLLLKRCKNESLDEVVIPPMVSALGESCFARCKNLTSVTFEGRLERIPYGTFWECFALEEIVWPQGLTTIENSAFYACTSLEEIEIPSGVCYIGREAFCGCGALTSVTVPAGLSRVGINAFEGCGEIFEVNISDLKAWCNVCFENEKASPLWANGGLCLNGEDIEVLRIPEGVYALNSFAFLHCDLIESVHLPASLGFIAPLAFYRCSGIEKITVASANITFRAVGGNCVLKGAQLVLACGEMETLPAGVRSVCAGAFSPCTDTYDFDFPASVSLNSGALVGLESLEMLSVPLCGQSLEILFTYEIGGYKVGGVPPYFDTLGLLGDKELGYGQLRGCQRIGTLKLGESCTAIKPRALGEVAEITELILPGSLTTVGAVDPTFNGVKTLVLGAGGPLEMREGCLVDNKKHSLIASFHSVKIPKGICYVAPYAFCGNPRVKEIYIGNGVLRVGEKAFSNCPNLERVTLGSSLLEVSGDVFWGSGTLREIVMEGERGWKLVRRSGYGLSAGKVDPSVPYWLRILSPSYNSEYEKIVRG